jgi:hypothetical protein
VLQAIKQATADIKLIDHKRRRCPLLINPKETASVMRFLFCVIILAE